MTENDELRSYRFIGVGCVTAIAGFFSGGMIGVLVAKIIGSLRGCQPEAGLPACDWHLYAFAGMLIGVVSLPLLALNRLRKSDGDTGKSK
jgi:hypothetical protein